MVSNGIGTIDRARELVADGHGGEVGVARKCSDCLGTGAVLDEDGSLTGVVGQPVACGCMGFLGCKVLAHPSGCGCREREYETYCRDRAVVPVRAARGPAHWWGE